MIDAVRFRVAPFRTPMYRAAAYLIASEAVSAALGLGFWVLAARTAADRDAGVASVLITTATLLATVSTAGLNFGLIRFLPERSGREGSTVTSATAVAVALAAALALAFGLLGASSSTATSFLARDPASLVLFTGFVVVWSAYLMFDAALVGLAATRFVLYRALVYGGLKLALPLLLIAVLPAPMALFSAWGIGLAAANLLTLLWVFPRVVRGFSVSSHWDRGSVAAMLRYAIGSHATTIFSSLPGLVFPLLITLALPAEHAVYFYVAWSLSGLLYLVPGSIFTSVFAEGSRASTELPRHTWHGLVLALGLLGPAVAVTLLASGPILTGVFSASYAPAVPALNVLALASLPLSLTLAYVASLRVAKRLGTLVVLSASISLGTLALGSALLPATGVMGAALAFALVQGAAAAVCAREMLRLGVLPRRASPRG